MPTKIINLTSHPVRIVCEGGMTLTFNPSGKVARVDIKQERRMMEVEVAEGVIVTVPVVANEHTEVYNLPDMAPDTMYIASSMVATAVNRPDVFAPNTDNTAERDPKGFVTAVKSLQQIFTTLSKEAIFSKMETYLEVVAELN